MSETKLTTGEVSARSAKHEKSASALYSRLSRPRAGSPLPARCACWLACCGPCFQGPLVCELPHRVTESCDS